MEFDETPKAETPVLTKAQAEEAKRCAELIARWERRWLRLREAHDYLVSMGAGVLYMEHRAEEMALLIDEATSAIRRLNAGENIDTVGEPPMFQLPVVAWVEDKRDGVNEHYLVSMESMTVIAGLKPTYPYYRGGYEVRWGRHLSYSQSLVGAGDAVTGLEYAKQWVWDRIDAILAERQPERQERA